jgi:hypothetical protein
MLQTIMCWWLVITLGAVGAYDIYAVLFVGGNSTVSFELYAMGKRFPSLYLLIGILIGHIVLPLHVSDSLRPAMPPMPMPVMDDKKGGK